MILQGLKPLILTQEGDGVPSVVWSLQSTLNRATNLTPFFMLYGEEAMLPTELQYGSPRVQAYQPDVIKEVQKDSIDLLEESRGIAITRSATYQHAL
jgi:hypothetical protein